MVGQSAARAEKLVGMLEAEGVSASLFHVSGEPTIELVSEGVAQARAEGCELVIGLGGGSALDAGKAIAALLTNPGDVYDYLEVVGKDRIVLGRLRPEQPVKFPEVGGVEFRQVKPHRE